MADIRVKDLNEASVPGSDYYLLTDSATDGVKKVKTTNVVKPVDIGAGATTSPLSQFAATTSAQLASVISDETGSGALVFATSPTLVTPTLGAAVATSINKVTITQPLTGATITIPEGVTVTGPAVTDTLVGRATTDTLTNKTISGTSNTLSNIGNSSLTNSSMTIAGHSVALGGSQDIAAADLTNGVTGTGAVVLASAPTLINPVVGTQTAGDNSTKAASTAFVQNAVVASGAPLSLFFATKAAVQAATIPSIVQRVETSGYATAGDGGGSIATEATYERVGSLPSHAGYIQSADGAYWELTGKRVSVRQFGAVPVVSNLDTDPDAAAAINLCMAYCNLKSSDMLIPSGQWPLDSAITSPTFIIEINGEQGGAQPTIIYKRYVEAGASKGVISLGAWGATITDLQFAAKSGVSGGSALSAILPNNAANIGMLHLERLYVSGGDGFNHNLYINGLSNINAGGPGYRSVFVHECHCFGCAITPIYLQGVEHLYGTDWFVATTGGTNSSGYIMIIDGSAASYGDDIQISSGLLSGNVNVNQTSRSMLMMRIDGNLTISSSCSGIVALSVGGTVTNSGTNCYVINEYNAWATSGPVPSPGGGAFGSASSSIAYKVVGKTVFCRGKVTISTVGTATGAVNIQLPFTLKEVVTFAGKEGAVNGLAFVAYVTTAGAMGILKYDNSSHIAAGAVFPFTFTAELA